MKPIVISPVLLVCAFAFPLVAAAAGSLSLPPATMGILQEIYSGRFDLAIPQAQALQREQPQHPLGYLLETEARWWQVWCFAAEYKYGMTLPRHKDRQPSDQAYLELAAKAESLATTSLAQQETAEMHFYAGMAEAQMARMYSLRGENRATARVGVRAREHFLKALALDPSLVDADLGLGLYNYYVDTLSTVARVLRFFMGIPGGSKEEGIRQLRRAMEHGQLTATSARFYLAMDLHNYDQKYSKRCNWLRRWWKSIRITRFFFWRAVTSMENWEERCKPSRIIAWQWKRRLGTQSAARRSKNWRGSHWPRRGTGQTAAGQ